MTKAGDTGVDFAWPTAGQDAAHLKQAGYSFVVRYLSYDKSGKNLTAAEYAAFTKGGALVIAVWEWGDSDAAKGYNTGKQHALDANKQADAVGYPKNRAIYYAVDSDLSVDAIDSYFQGVKAAGGRPAGIYASRCNVEAMIARGRVTYGWQANAKGWCGSHNDRGDWVVSDKAHLLQRVSHTHAGFPGDYDEDVALKADIGQGVQPVPAPAPAAPCVSRYFRVKDEDTGYEVVGGFKVAIPSREVFALVGGKLCDQVPASDPRAKLPEWKAAA